jgi:hypothetical protein
MACVNERGITADDIKVITVVVVIDVAMMVATP